MYEMLLTVNITFILICLVCGQYISLPSKTSDDVLIAIITQFSNYNTILHFDSRTMQNLDSFAPHALGPLFLINYKAEDLISRPLGYGFLNIVYLENPSQFGRFSEDYSNIKYTDVVLFITTTEYGIITTDEWNKPTPFQIHNLDKAGSVFILDRLSGSIYYKCFYCGPKSVDLEKKSIEEVLTVHDQSLQYTNFYKHHFKIGYVPYLQFFSCTASDVECHGPEAQLLQLLSESLNFEYSLENFEYKQSTGKWKTLIDAVHERQLDWGSGGLSLTPERSHLTDLTGVIHTEAYNILYRCTVAEKGRNTLNQMLKPFSFVLWLCILAMVLLIVLLLRYLPGSNSRLPRATYPLFENVLRALFEQPSTRFAFNSMTKRLILISWFYTCIILITAYKSKVVSMMIYSRLTPYDSLVELLQNGYEFHVNNEDWSVLKENFEASIESEKRFKEILTRTRSDLTVCDAVQKVVKSKVAYIDELSIMLYQVVNDCKANITAEEFFDLCLVEKEVFPSYHVWALQLGAPYRHRFSIIIENLHSAGILTFWYNSVLHKLLSRTRNQAQVSEISGLTLTTMANPILILGTGLILGLLFFVAEVLHFNFNNSIRPLKRRMCW